ncbi:MAG: asparagine synthase C-terminal domain-containing protein, partial [Verrucomicrobia bacterium]|nr:asparagine synthase C-terminal domain-containing protein [Verrucomicrobiota bacterium]
LGRAVRRMEFDYVLGELEVYTRLMGGLIRDDKLRYARAWGVDPDYDDYWYFRQHWDPDLPLLTRLQVLDFHTYLPDDILTKVDRASMQVALEVRVPLLSRAIIEFVFSLPEPVRYAGGILKGLLKKAFNDRLPPAILTRRKQGFSIPLQAWNMADTAGLPSIQERILSRDYAHVLPPLAKPTAPGAA